MSFQDAAGRPWTAACDRWSGWWVSVVRSGGPERTLTLESSVAALEPYRPRAPIGFTATHVGPLPVGGAAPDAAVDGWTPEAGDFG